MATSTRVVVEVNDGIAWITLDGPARRNALDGPAVAALIEACDRIDADASVGVAVVTGAGKAFCSGADTDALTALGSALPDAAYEGLDALYAGFRRLGRLTVPTVALIHGGAVGAGLNLALATDMRVVTPDALLLSGFAPIGIHPGGGHLHLLARAAGTGVAASVGVFGQPVRGEQAVACGLATRLVPTQTAREEIIGMVAHLAADPALARALAADLRTTVTDSAVWDRAVEIERARQMWSLARRTRED